MCFGFHISDLADFKNLSVPFRIPGMKLMYCLISFRCCSWTIAGWCCVKYRLAVCVLHADDCECPCFAGKILFAFVYDSMLH